MIKWLFLLGFIAGLVGFLGLVGLFLWHGREAALPLKSLHDYRPPQVTRVYSSDDQLLGELYVERRTVVPYARIPKVLINAVVAAEDAEFFRHQGLDYLGMLRAFIANLRAGTYRQGGSTITQQVVKTFLLSPERTVKRKVQEVILARRVEATLSKEEILFLYLNQIYYGHGRYGVEEAARFYFGKDVSKLTTGEAALIAGLPQSPERLSPLKHPEAAKERQRYVLEQMARHGYITVAEAKEVAAKPIRVVRDAHPFFGTAPEIVTYVREELERRLGQKQLSRTGLAVKTSIDARLQAAARGAVERGLAAIDERARQGAARTRRTRDVKRELQRLRRRHPKPPKEGAVVPGIVLAVEDRARRLRVSLGGATGVVDLHGETRYLPEKLVPSKRFARGDEVYVRVGRPPAAGQELPLHLELGPQAALVALDPKNRHVVALVGGHGFRPGDFDRARRAHRQPGSSFKPIVYAAALSQGTITPATVVNDSPDVFGKWRPDNARQRSYRGPVRIRVAVANSINTVAVKVINEVGVKAVHDLAKGLGITSPLADNATIALGSSAVTPLEITNAFAAFADEGRHRPPVLIVSVGQEATARPAPTQALTPEVAYLMTSLLRSVVVEGTARAARKLKWYACGKTGTNYLRKPQPGIRDAWFVGFTPDVVAGVWVGYDQNRPLRRGEQGSRAALPIWIDFMQQGMQSRPVRAFTPPPGIEVVRIDPRTGLLAAPGSAAAMDERFVQGTAPTETAPAEGEATPDSFVIDQIDDD